MGLWYNAPATCGSSVSKRKIRIEGCNDENERNRELQVCTDLRAAQGNSQYRQHSLGSVGPSDPSYTFCLIDLQRYLTRYLSQNLSSWVQARIYNLKSSTVKES